MKFSILAFFSLSAFAFASTAPNAELNARGLAVDDKSSNQIIARASKHGMHKKRRASTPVDFDQDLSKRAEPSNPELFDFVKRFLVDNLDDEYNLKPKKLHKRIIFRILERVIDLKARLFTKFRSGGISFDCMACSSCSVCGGYMDDIRADILNLQNQGDNGCSVCRTELSAINSVMGDLTPLQAQKKIKARTLGIFKSKFDRLFGDRTTTGYWSGSSQSCSSACGGCVSSCKPVCNAGCRRDLIDQAAKAYTAHAEL